MTDPQAAREITFSGTVVGWPDEGQRITVEVGPDCNEYPAIGESVRVVRHQAAQETMRTSTEGSNDARNETLDPDPAARETLRPDPMPRGDATFLADAATAMRERFDHGAAKFGRYSWRDYPYPDEDNLERLRRAVDHLEAARKNSDDPAEWRKRAADVANQAFMFADPKRKAGSGR